MDYSEIKELRYRLIISTSNISKRELQTEYKCQNKVIHSILINPVSWVRQGRSLYLYGNVGVGKTLGATTILKQYAKKLAEEDVFQEIPIFYVSLPDFLNECKRDIGRNREDLVAPTLIDKIKGADVAVLDEIGSIKALTEYEKNMLFEIIDQRTREMKATIYTSNSDSKKLRIALGEQLFSRVYTASDKIEMTGTDRRG